jgi:hypothetical protein
VVAGCGVAPYVLVLAVHSVHTSGFLGCSCCKQLEDSSGGKCVPRAATFKQLNIVLD